LSTAGFQYAGMWRRFGALLIDVFLAAMLLACAVLAWTAWSGDMPGWGSRTLNSAIAVAVVIALLLMILLDARLQGTPGLLLLDCRLVDARTGQAIGLGTSGKRTVYLLLAALPLLVGLLWIGWDPHKQGLHDKLAGTVVIREDYALSSLQELARGS
jgi:uncharacterized RDD family membrane protein YckC